MRSTLENRDKRPDDRRALARAPSVLTNAAAGTATLTTIVFEARVVDVETPHGIEPMWNLDRVGAHLDGHRGGCLFVSGCVAN